MNCQNEQPSVKRGWKWGVKGRSRDALWRVTSPGSLWWSRRCRRRRRKRRKRRRRRRLSDCPADWISNDFFKSPTTHWCAATHFSSSPTDFDWGIDSGFSGSCWIGFFWESVRITLGLNLDFQDSKDRFRIVRIVLILDSFENVVSVDSF